MSLTLGIHERWFISHCIITITHTMVSTDGRAPTPNGNDSRDLQNINNKLIYFLKSATAMILRIQMQYCFYFILLRRSRLFNNYTRESNYLKCRCTYLENITCWSTTHKLHQRCDGCLIPGQPAKYL